MNTIGINDNLDRARIRKLLIIGLFGSVLTGIGDFLVGFEKSPAVSGFAESMLAESNFDTYYAEKALRHLRYLPAGWVWQN